MGCTLRVPRMSLRRSSGRTVTGMGRYNALWHWARHFVTLLLSTVVYNVEYPNAERLYRHFRNRKFSSLNGV
jgi:hypothetical protein